jgi:hypothetical protein
LPWTEKSKPASIASAANQGSSTSPVASPHLAEEEEVGAEALTDLRAMRLPEVHCHVRDGVEPEAFEADPAREPEIRVHEMPGHLRQLGPQVRHARDTTRHVIVTAGAGVRTAEPGPRGGSCQVPGTVADVVVDDIQQQLDPSFVARLRERGQVLLRAKPPIQTREVVRPVAVVRPVGETGTRDEAVNVLHDRRDPQRGDAEIRDLAEVLAEPSQITAVKRAARRAIHVDVPTGIAVGEAVHDGEVPDLVGQRGTTAGAAARATGQSTMQTAAAVKRRRLVIHPSAEPLMPRSPVRQFRAGAAS